MILNNTLANHLVLMQALTNLNNALVRLNNPYNEPVASSLSAMFDDLNAKNVEADVSAIAKLETSGDLPKVSDELYNPSSDIFDTGGYTAYYPPVELPVGVPTSGEFEGDNNISCASSYLIKYNDVVLAIVKNYHTLVIIDNSQTSWPFPSLFVESLSVSPQIYGGRLGDPTFVEGLDVAGYVFSASYPLEIIYTSTSMLSEGVDLTASVDSMSFPSSVLYAEHAVGAEEIDSAPSILSMDFPLIVGYISYDGPPESIDTTGHIYALFFT